MFRSNEPPSGIISETFKKIYVLCNWLIYYGIKKNLNAFQISILDGQITDLLHKFETFANIWYFPLQNHVKPVIAKNHKAENEKISGQFTATVEDL
jgi:hypothetical protein